MSANPIIIHCPSTSWLKLRLIAISIMFGGFGFWFYLDGTSGYKESNVKYFSHKLITQEAPKTVLNFTGLETDWSEHLEKNQPTTPTYKDLPLPPETQQKMTWPDILKNNFTVLKKGGNNSQTIWLEYSAQQGWDKNPPEHPHNSDSLQTQLILAGVCSALTALSLLTLFIFSKRSMAVTKTHFISPSKEAIAFTDIFKIDQRKWSNKGIAYLFHKKDNREFKIRVDGMIYGQFKKVDGEPAEKLFQHILSHFEGEIIDYQLAKEPKEG